MKKKLLLCLFVLVALFTITGCGKGARGEDGKTTFTCVKKDIQRNDSLTNVSYTEDVKNIAKVDDDSKLVHYVTSYHYKYPTKESCLESCDAIKKWNDEINEKNYTGGHRETKCNCDNNEFTQEYIYDDIPNLASILRSDIKELKDDNTFDLENWINKYEKIKYNCG